MRLPKNTSRSAARRLHGAAAVIALAVLGCSPSYVYLPTEQVTAVVEGQPAARYAIPPEAPAGDVRIHSFGLVDLKEAEGGEVAALHTRLWVSNDSGSRPFRLDTGQVRVELRGPEGRPTVLAAGADKLPVVEIPPGEQRVVDMFFPLPEGYDHVDSLPAFDVVWQVQTEARAYAERTPFERIRVETPPAPPGPTWGFAYGTGFGWWYDPWWRPGAGYGLGYRGVMVLNRDVILQPRVHVRPMRPARPVPR